MRREAAFKVLVPLFFLSGATSLVYETIWARHLHLVFGTSQVAIATVLAAFMAGLAAGGLIMGRLADRIRRPVLAYGLLEAGIGVYALLFPYLLQVITPIYLGFWQWAEPSPTLFAAFQALLAGAFLLLPTTLMGATLPLLARFVTTEMASTGNRVGLLYGVNTAGAVLGTGMAGFVLLPAWGLQQTTFAAAMANFLLAGLAILQDRRLDSSAPPPVQGRPSRPAPGGSLLSVAFLAGAAALIYELAWFRLMTLTLGASTYAFTLMLLAFLGGIALGGWAGGPLADHLLRRHGRAGVLLALGMVQLAVAALSYGTMWLYGDLPYWYVSIYGMMEDQSEFFWPAQFSLALAVMAPSTIFMGATFPLAVRSLVTDPRRLGAPVGAVYGANTLGGILGAVAASLVLLPNIRIVGTVYVAGAVNILACLVALQAAWLCSRRFRRNLPLIMAPVAMLVVAATWPPPWNPLLMTAGMFKYVGDLSSYEREDVDRFAVDPYEMLYYAEGLSSVVTVARTRRTGNIWLANNGKVDASTTVDMPTQVLVAQLPFMMGRRTGNICIVGLASGISAGSVTLHPQVERIDIVELEPVVVQASHIFDEYNHRPLDDPRTRLVTNDARNHILLTPPGTYDVIISEPSNPWLSGVSNLFTYEFFQEGRRRLAPGGIWSQWIQMYGMGRTELKSLLRTFAQVFPHVLLFSTIEDADLVLLGSDQPLILDIDTVRSAMEGNPAVVEELEIIDIDSPFGILARFQADREAVLAMAADAPLNTDDNMLVEYSAPRRLYVDTTESNFLYLVSHAKTSVDAVRSRDDIVALARVYAKREEWVRALIVLQRAMKIYWEDDEMNALKLEWQRSLADEMKELREFERAEKG